MRLLIEFESLQDASYNLIHNYIIQGFIYSLLKDTDFAWLHSHKGFKFFNFSNIFPLEDFKTGKRYKLIISSPNNQLIRTLYRKLREKLDDIIKLGTLYFTLKKVRIFDLPLRFPWETATPVVLRKGKEVYISNGKRIYKLFVKNIDIIKNMGFSKAKLDINIKNAKEVSIDDLKCFDRERFKIVKIRDVYYSFKEGDSIMDWLRDLKNQSLLKYNLFTGSNFYFEEPLFDELEFRKEVAIVLRIKNRGDVLFIGTLWRKLNVIRSLDSIEKRFYKFLLDTGLGALNSLGFGFVNPKE